MMIMLASDLPINGWIVLFLAIVLLIYAGNILRHKIIFPVKVLPSLEKDSKKGYVKQAIARLLHDNGVFVEEYESLALANLVIMYNEMSFKNDDVKSRWVFLSKFLETEYGIYYDIGEDCTFQSFFDIVNLDLNAGAGKLDDDQISDEDVLDFYCGLDVAAGRGNDDSGVRLINAMDDVDDELDDDVDDDDYRDGKIEGDDVEEEDSGSENSESESSAEEEDIRDK